MKTFLGGPSTGCLCAGLFFTSDSSLTHSSLPPSMYFFSEFIFPAWLLELTTLVDLFKDSGLLPVPDLDLLLRLNALIVFCTDFFLDSDLLFDFDLLLDHDLFWLLLLDFCLLLDLDLRLFFDILGSTSVGDGGCTGSCASRACFWSSAKAFSISSISSSLSHSPLLSWLHIKPSSSLLSFQSP